jgi:hypothetical protein
MNGPPQNALPRLEKERADLAKAEQNIGDGQTRITERDLRIERMLIRGEEAARAEQMPATFRVALAGWYGHREEILRIVGMRPVALGPLRSRNGLRSFRGGQRR